jgi:hypothetical protein
MPTIDDYLGRLKRAGWGVGHAAFGATWQVDGRNGENAPSPVPPARTRVRG